MTFQPKIFRLKINKIQKSTVQTLGYLCSTTFQPKIFRLKLIGHKLHGWMVDGVCVYGKLYPYRISVG